MFISSVLMIIVSDSVVRCVSDKVSLRLCVMLLLSFIRVNGWSSSNVSIILFSSCGYKCLMLF